MNKVYKSVWNESIGAWVAVSENSPARGKRNGRVAKTVLASSVALVASSSVLAGALDGGTVSGTSTIAIGPSAVSSGDSDSIAIGHSVSSLASDAISIGSQIVNNAASSIVLGSNDVKIDAASSTTVLLAPNTGEVVNSKNSFAFNPYGGVGTSNSSDSINLAGTATGANGAVTIGSKSSVTATNAVAFGALASASAVNSVALGSSSVANRANTVSVGTASALRQVTNVGAGTQATDVVNVGQLSPVLNALGGKATVNADGSITAPTYSLKGNNYNNVGDALTALADSSGKYFHAKSTLADSTATGIDAIAIGGGANSAGFGNTAIGRNAAASGKNNAIAIGDTVLSTVDDAVSIGSQITNDAKTSVVLGSNGVTLDSASSRSVLLAPDTGAVTNSANSFSFNPYGGAGTSDSSDAVNLSGIAAGASGGVTIGSKSSVTAANAVALGASASASAADALAVGHSAKASVANSVALGANSVADRADTVSVGSTAGMRQITNIANGTQANDAVNVSQLQNVTTLLGGGAALKPDGTVTAPAYAVAGTTLGTVGAAIAKIDSELGNKVAYDAADKAKVTLGGVGTTNLVTISNVKAGDLSSASTDAVNGSQLNSTNQNVTTLQTFATNINNGGGIKFFHSNSSLADSSATGVDAVAIGGASVASADNSVAIGANSVAARPNTVSVGAAGKERQIVNVAAGTQSTDAVNVAQLTSVSQDVTKLASFAVKYDAKLASRTTKA
jgi:autotransporter adhesin